MTIKHLVIGGGGPFGLTAFGALKYLNEKQFWNLKDIKTIYATSIGTLICVYLTVGYDYDYIYDYLVKRPWEKILDTIGVQNFIEFYNEKGLMDIYTLYLSTLNLIFDAKELSTNITLKEYYEYCGIEFNFITVEVNTFKQINLSYKTHPDLELITALCMSSAFPMIFRPIVIDDKCYIDGGVFCNYAVNVCIEETGCNKNEILGVKKLNNKNNMIIDRNSTIINYLEKIMNNIFNVICDTTKIQKIPYEIECDMDIYNNYEEWINVSLSAEQRAALIHIGIKYAEEKYPSFIQDDILGEQITPTSIL